ncbi:MAG: hypothetical protein DRN30_02290 [Thermoplasmata archaeon]|nr:MAG: hypothetical protein DRN30_02290 [Thermoplasmata archaeon]
MNIGGKEREIKIGLNQSILYCELRGISITDMNSDLAKLSNGTGAELRDLIWSALKDGARVSGEEFNHTTYDVGDWIEELDPESLGTFINSLVESMPKMRPAKSKKKVEV